MEQKTPVVKICRGSEVVINTSKLSEDNYKVNYNLLSMPQFKIYCKQKLKETCFPIMNGEDLAMTIDFNEFVENIPDELLELKSEEAKRLLLMYFDDSISLRYSKKIDRDVVYELICDLYDIYKSIA